MLNKRLIGYILLIFMVLTFITPVIKQNQINIKDHKHTDLKSSSSWDLSGGTIYIDGDSSSRDWAYHATNYPWCFGSGTKNDPYIIENVTIIGSGTGSLLRIEDTVDHFIVRNCKFINGLYGISTSSVYNGIIKKNNISSHISSGIDTTGSNITILNNVISQNSVNGIYLASAGLNITGNLITGNEEGIYAPYCANSYFLYNNFTNNIRRGFILDDGGNCTIRNNLFQNNGEEGLLIDGSNPGTNVLNNIFDGNDIGIGIFTTSDIFISKNVVQNSVTYGMNIGGGYNRIHDNLITNNPTGIHVMGDGTFIEDNDINNNGRGVDLEGSYNHISKNNISYNIHGVFLNGFYGTRLRNNISSNLITYNSQYGIYFYRACENNTIFNNSIYHNVISGIYADHVPDTILYRYNLISNNDIFDGLRGIYFNCATNNYIVANNISGNSGSGILFFRDCHNNIISDNYIHDNENGINIDYDNHWNNVDNNTIYKNRNIGVLITTYNWYNQFRYNIIEENYNFGVFIDSLFNTFSSNYFLANSINANSTSTFNYWNSSTIGNFWDDNIPNTDVNDDGIGDSPYIIWPNPLIQDYLPIFDDGDDPAPPIISITDPVENQLTGKSGPKFQITIAGLHVHTTWYEILGIDNNLTFTGKIGNIDQSLWDELGNGTVTIRFYVNDTLGYGTMDEVTMRKDIYEPQLNINSPITDTLFDTISPSFIVEISDPNLDQSWYTIDGGLTNYTFTTNTTVNQTTWDSTPDGQVIINFYANDTVSNLAYNTVIVRKDTTSPLITINTPNSYDLFGVNTFNFNVEITDLNLEQMWYTIEGASLNIIFTSNGTINQLLWDSFGTGDLTLVFYANDTHGRISMNNVIISKDIDVPIISILEPQSGHTYYVNPPSYEIDVNDTHFESMWYTFDNGTINTIITSNTGSITQEIWNTVPYGVVTLRFYAQDEVGNTAYSEVTINKESVAQRPPGMDIVEFLPFIIFGSIAAVGIVLFVLYRKLRT